MTTREGAPPPAEVSATLRKAIAGLSFPNDPASHALHAYDLIFPELVQYREGWFRADRFDSANADNWFEHLKGDRAAVERMLNHIDVFEDYPRRSGDYEVVEANAFADVLVFSWPIWAKRMYGIHIQCHTYFEDMEDGEGPEAATVTFWSSPTFGESA